MLISFFSTTDYTTGIDYSSHPNLIHQEDLPFDPSTHSATLTKEDGVYRIVIEDLPPPPETEEQKRSRIIQSLISADSLEDIDLEGALFSDQDIGEIILQRVFNGNKFGESALQGKISAYILSFLQNTPNTALFSEIADKQAQVNEVRVFFGLTPIA